ncbi:hypothetical protein PR048_019995 [Dryococelus australis]|uniref:Uncharacterized protein n=1 Tax=Dryococelus australis TaxID=614101 RepID=A0ABQ9H556_9NEOP|nr:hypothetical protein PR048_019995 [Dryococelus australis]
MWPECKVQRGYNEIASCVKEFIDETVRKVKNNFYFFSDNCGGQNLNHNVVSVYIYAAVHHNVDILHHFMERGHAQNEGDSIHSVIERSSKKIPIYTPMQWYAVVRVARRKMA